MAIKPFTVPITKAIASVIPKHTLLKGILLLKKPIIYEITTQSVAQALFSRGLDHLIDRSLDFIFEPITHSPEVTFQYSPIGESTIFLNAMSLEPDISVTLPSSYRWCPQCSSVITPFFGECMVCKDRAYVPASYERSYTPPSYEEPHYPDTGSSWSEGRNGNPKIALYILVLIGMLFVGYEFFVIRNPLGTLVALLIVVLFAKICEERYQD